jgi:outer membrane protein OmpA-like peptidoglycan-associated protein
MKKMKLLMIGIIGGAMLTSGTYAQDDDNNLVPNPGFESIDGKKLKKQGQVEMAKGWFSPTQVNADVFASDAGADLVKTPDNYRGKEAPADGSNYAGIVAFSFGDKLPRTYLMAKLDAPLKKGSKYCVQFQVSLSDLSKYACNNIGAHLSKKAVERADKGTIIAGTHVKHSMNKVFDQQFGWETICTIVESTGGEEWIVIGNFTSNKETKNTQMKKPASMGTAKQTADAYYYIDNVKVFYLDSIEQCLCEKPKVAIEKTDVIYTKQVISNKELTFEEKLDNASIYFYELSDVLTESAENELRLLAEDIKNQTEVIYIHGHDDVLEEKAAELNPRHANLAQRRADSVRIFLENQGVPANLLQLVDHGDKEPDDQSDSDVGHAKNRRVELHMRR